MSAWWSSGSTCERVAVHPRDRVRSSANFVRNWSPAAVHRGAHKVTGRRCPGDIALEVMLRREMGDEGPGGVAGEAYGLGAPARVSDAPRSVPAHR